MPQYYLTGYCSGTWSRIIEADSKEAAEAIFNAEAEAKDFDPGMDECDDVGIYSTVEVSRGWKKFDGSAVWANERRK